jgi:hypothetical protein
LVESGIFELNDLAKRPREFPVLILGILFLWAVLLTPFAVRHMRNGQSEKSIREFRNEHLSLRRRGYSVQPARILEDEPPLDDDESWRPRLRVVREDDTPHSLEAELSWEEWGRRQAEHDGVADLVAPVAQRSNPYAAYATAPSVQMTAHHADPLTRPLSMRTRRNRIFLGLVTGALVTTLLNLVVGSSLLQYAAIVLWVSVVVYVAMALVAISQGYLDVSSLAPGRRRTPLRVVPSTNPHGFAEDDESWRQESARYALG